MAFKNCTNLVGVSLSSAVELGTYVFDECSSLERVELDSAVIIGNDVFNKCSGLTYVYMPKATSFGDNIFYGCTTANIDLTLNSTLSGSVQYNAEMEQIWQYVSSYDAQIFSYTFKSITLAD